MVALASYQHSPSSQQLIKKLILIISIAIRFMVDQRPFLFEALARVDNNTFHFQQHFKVACDLLPPLTCTCFPPFKQPIKQQMTQLQDSILKCLHHHTLSNMFSNMIFETHHARKLSCSSFEAGVWLIIQLTFLTFWLSSPSFSTTFQMWLGLPHPSIVGIPQCYKCPPFMLRLG